MSKLQNFIKKAQEIFVGKHQLVNDWEKHHGTQKYKIIFSLNVKKYYKKINFFKGIFIVLNSILKQYSLFGRKLMKLFFIYGNFERLICYKI
jgi:hypothetical protein